MAELKEVKATVKLFDEDGNPLKWPEPIRETTYVTNRAVPVEFFHQKWRTGEQLQRTIYATDENQDWFLGIMESIETAHHLVLLHNEWIDKVRSEKQLQKKFKEDYGIKQQQEDKIDRGNY